MATISPAGQAAEKIAMQLVKQITKTQVTVATNRWVIAQHVYELAQLPWKLTTYKTFSKFARKNLPMSLQIAYLQVTYYKEALRLGYTPANLKSISKYINFSNTYRIFTTLDKRMNVHTFCSKYKNLKSVVVRNATIISKVDASGATGNIFHIVLTDAYARKLDKLLVSHGLNITKAKQKQNLSKAMCNYLDTI